MPYYKYTYFNAKARGEIVRLMLTAAGQKFDDNRIDVEDWPALKASTPWGFLPFLEIDGKQLAQTQAIVRYLAHKFDLAGSGDWECALVDSAVDAAMDIWSGMDKVIRSKNEEKDNELRKYKASLPILLQQMEKFIEKHGKNGHVVGHKTTTADIALYNALDQIEAQTALGISGAADNLPRVQEVFEKIRTQPNILTYVTNRPQTQI